MSLFSFLTAPSPNATAAAGMQQYNQQGSGAVDPGLAPAMQGGQAPALGAALQQLIQQKDTGYNSNSPQAMQGPNFMGSSQPMSDANWQTFLTNGGANPSMAQQVGNWGKTLFGGGNG